MHASVAVHSWYMLVQFARFLIRKIGIYPFESLFIFGLSGAVMLIAAGFWNPLVNVISVPPPLPPQAKHRPPERYIQPAPDKQSQEAEAVDSGIRFLIAKAESKIVDAQDESPAIQREILLLEVAEALTHDQKARLGYLLCLLGHLSVREQELHTAQVYLLESMDIFQDLGYTPGIAQVNLQLGHLHARNRQIARIAGTAYDELQLGRWYLANDMPEVAEPFILNSIDRNLSINRYNPAASAHYSLAGLYAVTGREDRARDSILETLRMFASSGRIERARKILAGHSGTLVEMHEVAGLSRELELRHQTYLNQLLQIERARDYRRLYFYYQYQGETRRAWHFRILANESLKQTSKRALFHRQNGILALLYNSNEDAELARSYLNRARLAFDRLEMPALSRTARQLHREIH